jgi:hypothetical protein
VRGPTRTVPAIALGLALAGLAGAPAAAAAPAPAAQLLTHDGSDSPGGDMPGMDMPGMDMPGMDMPGGTHDHQHATATARPRDLVIGGFVGANLSVLVVAGLKRRRKSARRGPRSR